LLSPLLLAAIAVGIELIDAQALNADVFIEARAGW
jgi:hypothetical protein